MAITVTGHPRPRMKRSRRTTPAIIVSSANLIDYRQCGVSGIPVIPSHLKALAADIAAFKTRSGPFCPSMAAELKLSKQWSAGKFSRWTRRSALPPRLAALRWSPHPLRPFRLQHGGSGSYRCRKRTHRFSPCCAGTRSNCTRMAQRLASSRTAAKIRVNANDMKAAAMDTDTGAGPAHQPETAMSSR